MAKKSKWFPIMKKIILYASILVAIFVTENTMAQVTLGPKFAFNISNIHDKLQASSYTRANNTYKVGFQIGGILNAQINNHFIIRPELTFNSIGAERSTINYNGKITTNYLSLPVNIVCQYPLNDHFMLQAFAGPYASLGLGGKYKFESPTGNKIEKVYMKKDPGNNNNNNNNVNVYQNPLDFGITFGVGFQEKSFVVSASYALGLTNTEPHYTDPTSEANRGEIHKTTNRNISFSFAYLFGGK
jgi:hypothetical protein